MSLKIFLLKHIHLKNLKILKSNLKTTNDQLLINISVYQQTNFKLSVCIMKPLTE